MSSAGQCGVFLAAKSVGTVFGPAGKQRTLLTPSDSAIPSYRKHKAYEQAIVTLNDHDEHIGPHGSKSTAAELPMLCGGFKWQIKYGAFDVVLAVAAVGLFDDYSWNDEVDAADFTVWRDTFAAAPRRS
ncbi:MAG: hypothetical protein AB7G28_21500 [Pirellulales bacterium]